MTTRRGLRHAVGRLWHRVAYQHVDGTRGTERFVVCMTRFWPRRATAYYRPTDDALWHVAAGDADDVETLMRVVMGDRYREE